MRVFVHIDANETEHHAEERASGAVQIFVNLKSS